MQQRVTLFCQVARVDLLMQVVRTISILKITYRYIIIGNSRNIDVSDDDKIQERNLRFRKKCKKALIIGIIICTCSLVIATCTAAIILLLHKQTNGTDLVVKGDLVLLQANSSGRYSTKITFKNKNFTADYIQPNITTNVYAMPCKDVHQYETQDSPRSYQPQSINFSSCGGNKCVLDEYWYCSKSDAALMMYMFNFTAINKGEELEMLVFDDAAKYENYIKGYTGPESAMSSMAVPTANKYWEFIFSSAKMIKAVSYYFFVIVANNGGPEPFLVAKKELRTYFNVSMLLPNCKVINSSSCSSDIGRTKEDYCYLARVEGHVNTSSYGPQDMIYVSYYHHHGWSTFYIAAVVLLILAAVVTSIMIILTIVVFVILLIYCLLALMLAMVCVEISVEISKICC